MCPSHLPRLGAVAFRLGQLVFKVKILLPARTDSPMRQLGTSVRAWSLAIQGVWLRRLALFRALALVCGVFAGPLKPDTIYNITAEPYS